MRAAVVTVLTLGLAVLAGQPGTGATRPTTGRLIVKLAPPAEKAEVPWLARLLEVRVIQVMPGGEYLLVVPRSGDGARELKARSKRVVLVEPEISMGVAR